MSTGNALRWSGLAAILGGVLLVPGSFIWDQASWAWVATLGWLLFIFGMFGIYAFQIDQSGVPGFLGFVLSVTGAVFLMGAGTFAGIEYWTLGSLFSAIGLILFAVGTLSARKFPRWVAWLWFAALVVGLPSVFGPSFAMISGVLGAAALGAGMVIAGYHLFTRGAASM